MMHHKDDAAQGLYKKFAVEREDGRDQPGQKHDGCDYFVLDWKHDPFALPAVEAYAQACEAQFPRLARDLRARVEIERRRVASPGDGTETGGQG